MNFLTRSGVEVRVTCLAKLHFYLFRKEGTYLKAHCEDRNVHSENPLLHATGQREPPEGHGWAGDMDVVIGRFSQPFPKSLSRQRVQIKTQDLRPYKEWDDSTCHIAGWSIYFNNRGLYLHSQNGWNIFLWEACSNSLFPSSPFLVKHEISHMKAHSFLYSFSCFPYVLPTGFTSFDKQERCQIIISVWCLETSRIYGYQSESQEGLWFYFFPHRRRRTVMAMPLSE